jgi:hypothetical protein
MKMRLLKIIGAVLIIATLAGCAAPILADQRSDDDGQFSLARLPASGYINLDPVNDGKLNKLGLGPEPVSNPPSLPYNQFGVYWSQQVQMYEGDTLLVKITSDTPVSWFGVDWNVLNLRGIVAKMDLDEDGHTFDPQYPVDSSASMVDGKYILSVKYKFDDDAKCVLVVKNNSTDIPWHVLINAGTGFNFSFEKILKKLGLIKTSDEVTFGDPDG